MISRREMAAGRSRVLWLEWPINCCEVNFCSSSNNNNNKQPQWVPKPHIGGKGRNRLCINNQWVVHLQA